MDFFEKLRRRAAEVNQSKASRAVGLKPNTISTYIAKRSLPRADIARRIALALEVPLDWLLDDEQDWPPPAPERPAVDLLSDSDLMAEVARRYVVSGREIRKLLATIARTDWVKAASALLSIPLDDAVPQELTVQLILLSELDLIGHHAKRFEASAVVSDFVQIPSNEVKEINPEQIIEDAKDLREKMPGLRQAMECLSARFLSGVAYRRKSPENTKAADEWLQRLRQELAALSSRPRASTRVGNS